MKSFRELREDAPVNSVGSGAIAGANGDPPVKRKPKVLRRKFAQHEVFVVNTDVYTKCSMRPKFNVEKYDDLVGTDATGKAIRKYAKEFPGEGIMIENEKTGYMTWLRLPKNGMKF